MSSAHIGIIEKLNRLAAETSRNVGIDVVRVLFIKEHGKRILRVTINREGGVSLNDCETFSRAFSALLDEQDIIDEHYYLEVESPGISMENK